MTGKGEVGSESNPTDHQLKKAYEKIISKYLQKTKKTIPKEGRVREGGHDTVDNRSREDERNN